MKSRPARVLFALVFAVTASALVGAQLQLGQTNMAVSRASSLNMPISVSRGVAMRSFAMRVGGVAFDRTARPTAGLAVAGLSVAYDPAAEDGRRLLVTINGTATRPFMPDWQLVPIARVVESGRGSLVTLFGEMPTRAEAEAVTDRGGRIVNYHPQLENQLLGLRMLQLDMLIFNEDASDLPTIGSGANRRYVLGLGEQRPNVAGGRAAFALAQARLEGEWYRSYIVSDYEREVTFGIVDGHLQLSGSPYFYFWRTRGDAPDFRERGEDIVVDEVNSEYRRDVASGKVESMGAWCRARIEQLQTSKDFADLAAVPGGSVSRLSAKQLDAMAEEARCSTLLEWRYLLEVTRVVHLRQLSDTFSARTAELAAINPAVWDAAVRTMQYGAFLRYYRTTSPARWEQFIASVREVTPEPTVKTPTEVYMPHERVASSNR